jgi:hypothetical protein
MQPLSKIVRIAIPLALTCLLAGCSNGSENVDPICGDDLIQEGEDCDKTRLNGKTCADFDFDTGYLACTADCTFDTSGCENLPEDCGNGDIDEGEDCDGNNLGDATCESQGYLGGDLACQDCVFDESGCEPLPCGNGDIDDGEECDGDNLDGWICEDYGFDTGALGCTDACMLDAAGCTGCDDDASEENDDLASAADLSEGSHALQMCNTGGEEDWFSFDLTLDDVVVVSLTQDRPTADLDLELTDPDGFALASSNNLGLEEMLVYTATETGTFYLRVFSYDGGFGATDYSLGLVLNPECLVHLDCGDGEVCDHYICVTFVCSDENPCPDDLVCDGGACVECATAADCPEEDAYTCDANLCVYGCTEDSNEPNSTEGEAADIAVGFSESALTLCGEDDEDWFQVDLEALHLYELSLTFSQAAGDIDVQVFEAADMDTPVAAGYSNTDNEQVTIGIGTGEAGSYLVAVKLGFDQLAQTYDMALVDGGAVTCVWDNDCLEEELCLENQCVVPDCIEDEDCTAPQRCVDLTCVDAPAGDTCADPIVVDTFPYLAEDVDMSAFRNDIAFAEEVCTDWGTDGKDVIYQVALTSGQQLWATVSSDFDAALTITSDCTVAPSADACLDGADGGFAGDDEEVYLLVDSDQTVYVVVDSFAPGYPDEGAFTLAIEVE